MELTLSLLSAVEFIHSEKDSFGCIRMPMAHRDIKVSSNLKKKCNNIQSSNILVGDCGKSVVLADFGLSMRLSSEMYSSSQSIGQAGNLISIRASSSLCFRNKSLHEP